MKSILGALALILAVPAAAQAVPAADPHATHSGARHGPPTSGETPHKGMDQSKTMDCCCAKMKKDKSAVALPAKSAGQDGHTE